MVRAHRWSGRRLGQPPSKGPGWERRAVSSSSFLSPFLTAAHLSGGCAHTAAPPRQRPSLWLWPVWLVPMRGHNLLSGQPLPRPPLVGPFSQQCPWSWPVVLGPWCSSLAHQRHSAELAGGPSHYVRPSSLDVRSLRALGQGPGSRQEGPAGGKCHQPPPASLPGPLPCPPPGLDPGPGLGTVELLCPLTAGLHWGPSLGVPLPWTVP